MAFVPPPPHPLISAMPLPAHHAKAMAIAKAIAKNKFLEKTNAKAVA